MLVLNIRPSTIVEETRLRVRTRMKITGLLSFPTGAGILLQWILVWSGMFPIVESVPGFRNYFFSFVIADFWLIVAAFLTTIFTPRRDPKAILFGIALGSAMIFFSLYAFMYDLNTGLLTNVTADELFGKAVTLYNFLGGVVFMVLSWGSRNAFGMKADLASRA